MPWDSLGAVRPVMPEHVGLDQPTVKRAIRQAQTDLDRVAGDQVEAGSLKIDKGRSGELSHRQFGQLLGCLQSVTVPVV